MISTIWKQKSFSDLKCWGNFYVEQHGLPTQPTSDNPHLKLYGTYTAYIPPKYYKLVEKNGNEIHRFNTYMGVCFGSETQHDYISYLPIQTIDDTNIGYSYDEATSSDIFTKKYNKFNPLTISYNETGVQDFNLDNIIDISIQVFAISIEELNNDQNYVFPYNKLIKNTKKIFPICTVAEMNCGQIKQQWNNILNRPQIATKQELLSAFDLS